MKKILITGGAGFIGSQLADHFLSSGHRVIVIDNLSWGKKQFISHNFLNPNFKFIKADLLNLSVLEKKLDKEIDTVFHLAANSDIMKGTSYPDVDFENTTLATFNLLKIMRNKNIKKIFYTSGSGVYGDVGNTYTPENYGPLSPISLYGANKLAAESLISAFVHLYDMQAWILRPANIIGPRATHGVIFDFINKLKKDPNKLVIYGDGKQSKSYLYITDVISAINIVWLKTKKSLNLFNIASSDAITVAEIARIVIRKMKLKNVQLQFTGGSAGWKGDVPIVRLNINAIKKIGWTCKFNSKQAVEGTVEKLLRNYDKS